MSVQIPTFVTLQGGIATAAIIAQNGDQLGSNPTSVAISADTSVIVGGASLFGASDTGRLLIFKRSTITDDWIYTSLLTSPLANVPQNYGTSVAITNDNSIIAGGAPGTLGGRIFLNINNPYTNSYRYYQTLRGSGIITTGTTPQFGTAIAFSDIGNYLVAGAPGCNFAYVFTSNVSSLYTEQQRFTSPIAAANFGKSCRISGDGNYILVGAPSVGYPGALTNRGMAFMYKKDIGTDNWNLVQNISTPAIAVASAQFGTSCDINYDGNFAVVACLNRSSFFFKKTPGSDFWNHLQTVTTSDTLSGNGFMASISYSGSNIAIGNRRLPTSDKGGVLYFQKRSDTDSWVQLSTLQVTGPGSKVSEYQGAGGMISRDGTYVVYGGPGYNTNDGNIYVSYRDWTSYMPSTNTVGLIGLASTSRNTVVLPKASTITSQMTWIKDTTPYRTNYNFFTISTSGGDLLDNINNRVSFCNAGTGLQFAHDSSSNWYTLNYYDGK